MVELARDVVVDWVVEANNEEGSDFHHSNCYCCCYSSCCSNYCCYYSNYCHSMWAALVLEVELLELVVVATMA